METILKDHRVLSQSLPAHRSDPPDKEQQVLSVGTEVAPKTSRPNLPEDLPVAIRSKRAIDDSVTVPPYPVAPPVFSRSLQLVARSKRATDDEYSQAMHRGQQLARITNAIYLYQAIAMKQVQSEVLISELLRIGSVKASDISSIDPTTINKIVEDVDKLATSLKSDGDIQRIEERMKLYASMLKKTEAFMKDQQIAGKEEFIQTVRHLKAKNVNMDELSAFAFNVYSALESLEKLRDPKQSKFEAGQIFPQLEGFLKKVNHVDAKALESDQLRNGPEIFKPLFLVRQSLEDFNNSPANIVDSRVDKKPIGEIQNNMKALNEVVSEVDQKKAMIDNMCRMFLTSHHPNGNVTPQYTHGFTDGYLDLLTVFKDLEDNWIKTAVREQAAQLAKGLNYLNDLYEKSKSVAQHLQMEEPVFKVMSSRCDSLAFLADLATKIDPLSSELEQIEINDTSSKLRPANDDQFNTLLDNIQTLSKNLKAVDDVAQLANELRDEKGIDKLLSITEESKQDLDKAWNKIKNDPEVASIYEMISKRKKSLEIVKTGKALDVLVEIDASFNEVDSYISGLSVYIGYLQKLRNLAGTKFIKKVVGGIEKFRGVNSPGSIAKTVNLVDDIKSKVAELKKTVDEMKVDTAPESKALEAPDLSEVSKTIGSAVQGINSMKTFAAFPQDRHQKLKTGCELVKKQIGGVPVDPEDLKNLQLLISLPSQLDTISNGISSMKSSTTVSLEDKITAQAVVFQSAASVQGLQYDFIKMANSVEELLVDLPAGPESDSIKEIIPILKELESIGLDFSKHKAAFQDSKSKLDELDLFFANYKDDLAKKKLVKDPQAGPFSTQLPGGLSSLNGTTTSAPGSSTGIIIAGSIVAVFAIAGGIATFFGIRRWKNKKAKDLEQGEPLLKSDKTQEMDYIPFSITTDFLIQFVNHLINSICAANNKKQLKDETLFKMFESYFKKKFNAYSPSTWALLSQSIKMYRKYIRGDVPLSKQNRIALENKQQYFPDGTPDLFIHGNLITLKNGTKIAIMQAPMDDHLEQKLDTTDDKAKEDKKNDKQGDRKTGGVDKAVGQKEDKNQENKKTGNGNKKGNEPDQADEKGTDIKKNNIEKWWYKVFEMQSKVVISLTRQHVTHGGGEQCAKYYPDAVDEILHFGNLTVKCCSLQKSHKLDDDEMLETRKLSLKFGNQPEYFIEKHYTYVGWPKGGCPGSDDVVLQLCDVITSTLDAPVVLHSSLSTGRAGCMLLILHTFQSMDLKTGKVQYENVFDEVRQWRANSVENHQQYQFCFFIFFRLIFKDYDEIKFSENQEAAGNYGLINDAISSFFDYHKNQNKNQLRTLTENTAEKPSIRSVSDQFASKFSLNRNNTNGGSTPIKRKPNCGPSTSAASKMSNSSASVSKEPNTSASKTPAGPSQKKD